MYCPNCGKKADDWQKFCQHCGIKLQFSSEQTQSNYTANAPTYTTRSSTRYIPQPVYPNRPIPNRRPPVSYSTIPIQSYRRKKGDPGSFSKICFAIGFIAFLTSMLTFIIGGISVFYFHGPAVMLLVKITMIIVFHITGFALGVISIGIKKTVARTEPINNYEQAGHILGIFAIIFNVIGVISAIYGTIFIIL